MKKCRPVSHCRSSASDTNDWCSGDVPAQRSRPTRSIRNVRSPWNFDVKKNLEKTFYSVRTWTPYCYSFTHNHSVQCFPSSINQSINTVFVGRRYTTRPGAPTIVSGKHDQKLHYTSRFLNVLISEMSWRSGGRVFHTAGPE